MLTPAIAKRLQIGVGDMSLLRKYAEDSIRAEVRLASLGTANEPALGVR